MPPHTAFNPRFLVISLGNPPPLLDTLHSAGHLALSSMQKLLGSSTQPPFEPYRHGKKACLHSPGPKYHLLQSPTLMNATGPWLAKAWRDFLEKHELSQEELSLVLVHDDIEEDLGVVKTRLWNRSHRGHNGIKSVLASLPLSPVTGFLPQWARISVGIGRPVDRDRKTVSDYVLRPITKREKSVIQDVAAPTVLQRLLELETQWKSKWEKHGGNMAGLGAR